MRNRRLHCILVHDLFTIQIQFVSETNSLRATSTLLSEAACRLETDNGIESTLRFLVNTLPLIKRWNYRSRTNNPLPLFL